MKIKALLATIIGAVAINGATAGDWCPPTKDKCPVECCPETAGNLSFGYDTDYIWRGVRLARDIVWADVNYAFDVPLLPFTPVVGVWHGTTLDSVPGSYGDETNIYAGAALPEIMGLTAQGLFTHYLFPNQRASGGPGQVGDGFSSIGVSVTGNVSDILGMDCFAGIPLCGLTIGAGSEYFLGGSPSGGAFSGHVPPQAGAGQDLSAWYHYAEGGYTMELTDSISAVLTAGVSYSDGLWSGRGLGNTGSGWNHYYVRAAAPLQIGCNAVLTPYIGYNGTPDGWKAGNADSPHAIGENTQDALHGGVSITVGF